ncbi:hypothetical protein [Humibacter sp. RRB41]|uniref:hypothetical protein n=1 Tax=Humibacter sp. RRB41 TaxID=2919946 RepID=UPI001FAB17CC|nr:hypothetical protein [Humibacter sp. RRB41]
MGVMAFDGIYGEADTWLTSDDVAAAYEESERMSGPPLDIDDLRDLDEYRVRQRRI